MQSELGDLVAHGEPVARPGEHRADAPGPLPAVRAKMTNTSATPPLVIHTLDPVTLQPSSVASARVRSDAVSEPASGSVRA